MWQMDADLDLSERGVRSRAEPAPARHDTHRPDSACAASALADPAGELPSCASGPLGRLAFVWGELRTIVGLRGRGGASGEHGRPPRRDDPMRRGDPPRDSDPPRNGDRR